MSSLLLSSSFLEELHQELRIPSPGEDLMPLFSQLELILQHEAIVSYLSASENGLLPEYPANFLEVSLPEAVKVILHTKNYTRNTFELAFALLNHILDLVVCLLPLRYQLCCELLLKMFDKEQNYFFRSRIDDDLKPWIRQNIELLHHFARPGMPSYARVEPDHISSIGYLMDSPSQNHVLVAHLNLFGNRGGFNLLFPNNPSIPVDLETLGKFASLFA